MKTLLAIIVASTLLFIAGVQTQKWIADKNEIIHLQNGLIHEQYNLIKSQDVTIDSLNATIENYELLYNLSECKELDYIGQDA